MGVKTSLCLLYASSALQVSSDISHFKHNFTSRFQGCLPCVLDIAYV